jgi:hypothetical protein
VTGSQGELIARDDLPIALFVVELEPSSAFGQAWRNTMIASKSSTNCPTGYDTQDLTSSM